MCFLIRCALNISRAIMKCMSTLKSAAVKDIGIGIDIADIVDHKYRYRIGIGKYVSFQTYRKS